jgi:ribosomal protein S18 acetylase RimI-like enzyme
VEQLEREQLDNAVWHALRGSHHTLAEACGTALRYRSSVSPFAGIPDTADAAAWSDLAELVGAGNIAVLFRDEVNAPTGWNELDRIPTYQMSAETVTGGPMADAELLTTDDVADMLALVERSKPGPLAAETILMGSYFGWRNRGRLVAMAGERLRAGGLTEISAICTDADHRGHGLASGLTRHLVAHIRGRGEEPFLHVAMENEPAHRLYRQLGFVERREVVASILQAPVDG